MAELRKVVVDDRGGDGEFLRRLPKGVARPLRKMVVHFFREQRQKRLMRVARRVYPALQVLEQALPEDQRILAAKTFEEAFFDDRAIERGLLLFRAAWENGAMEFRVGARRVVVEYGATEVLLGSCGMSITSAERFFLYRAARLIFSEQKIRFNAKGMLTDPSVLVRLRMLASMGGPAVNMLHRCLGERFKEIFYPEHHMRLQAIAKLKAFHIESLADVLGGRSPEVAGWKPEFIQAIAESISCAEQIRDIGNHILSVKGPAAVRALGRWYTRDITEKVNEERSRRSQTKLVGKSYETDIGIVHNILGGDFSLLMEQPPELLDAVRMMVSHLRTLEKIERGDRIEEFRLWVKRYLPYMTPEVLDALHLTHVGDGKDEDQAAPPVSFREALGILEGLWTKEGLGRAFFEQVMPTPHGATALRNLVQEVLTMKQRGSIKPNTDIKAILAGSDLFDSHLIPYMKKNMGIM